MGSTGRAPLESAVWHQASLLGHWDVVTSGLSQGLLEAASWHQDVTTQWLGRGWSWEAWFLGASPVGETLGCRWKEAGKGKKFWRRSLSEIRYHINFINRNAKRYTKKYFSLTSTWNDSLVLPSQDRIKIHISIKSWCQCWSGIKQDSYKLGPNTHRVQGKFSACIKFEESDI